ncbi:MAG: tryptophan--tRNA ligase [Candidatus Aenigmarchaeota archaeon]|nr:tryptophan--tRNA ligase [Candidatus Aenigmarchaeota archaeon]
MTKMVVTPWEVSGKIDYDRLIKEFGTQKIDNKLLRRIESHAGELHFMLTRRLFFSHRDVDWLLDKYDKGEKFYLYTGRGPSGHTHIGHLVPWIFTKWLQDKFNADLYFQMTDDEKFVFNPELSLEETNKMSYENALDVIALGFDPEKTFIFSDIDYAKTLYREALKVSKKLTFSTAKAVFGFENSSNVGQIFFTSVQSVPAFLPSVKAGKNIPCLIPYAIDQDAHFRVCRDILPKLGFYKPAAIHTRFLPGLKGPESKMSASIKDSVIFTTDSAKDAKKKIMSAFSGGAASLEEHRKKGGDPDVDVACQYLYFMFEEDDEKVKEIFEGYRSGSITSGDVKKMLVDKVTRFLENHQKKRERAKKKLDKFILTD